MKTTWRTKYRENKKLIKSLAAFIGSEDLETDQVSRILSEINRLNMINKKIEDMGIIWVKRDCGQYNIERKSLINEN